MELKIITAQEYFAESGRKVFAEQSEAIQQILSLECSVYVLRRTVGLFTVVISDLMNMRRGLIDLYELSFEDYIEYREFY